MPIVLNLSWAPLRADEPPKAATTQTGQDSTNTEKGKLDPDFLLLPAFDLEASATNPGASKVGDQIRFKVATAEIQGIKNPTKDLHVEAPSGINLQEEGWEIAQAPDLSFIAIPLKPGNLGLPSLALKDTNGKAVARTNPITVEIKSAIKENDPQPTQPADVEPPVGLVFPFWIVLGMGIVAVILVAALIFFAYRLWKKRKPKKVKTVTVVLPEDELALKGLTELVNLGLLKKGQFKEHYFKVSEILKAYIGSRYRFDALESTTREMISVLEEKKAAGDSVIDHFESLFEKLVANTMDKI